MKPLLCFALVTLLFTSHAAFADEQAATQTTYNTIEGKIANTSLSYGINAGYGIRLWGSQRPIDMAVGTAHIAFPLTGPVGSSWYRGVLSYKIELQGGIMTTFDERSFVGFVPVGFRYNFTPAGKFVPYFDGMLGVAYLDVPRYVQGTRFNFTQNAALGALYFITQDLALDLQARYTHISNAGIRKPNDGINEGFLLLGISYY